MKPKIKVDPGFGFVAGHVDRNGKVDILVDYGIRLKIGGDFVPMVMAYPEGNLQQPLEAVDEPEAEVAR